MQIGAFFELLGADFYTGVPDSQLKALCDYLLEKHGTDPAHHIIAANEGNAVGIAAGYYLATGRVPVVYMQNSGEGNAINPMASLLSKEVYGIPCIFVIGWRGEPGVPDEPQHFFQGRITCRLLEVMDVPYYIVDERTTEEEFKKKKEEFTEHLEKGRQVAFVIRKGALLSEKKCAYENDNRLVREDVIREIVKYSGSDMIVSTTGKASRELFEIREWETMTHEHDFLTVGSMGHASSIALGLALHRPDKRIWCIDGDGAVLMHMGAMAVIGSQAPDNLVHVVINNGAHESVGGMPTVMNDLTIADVARLCGYRECYSVSEMDELAACLEKTIDSQALTLLEVKTKIGSRPDLGRPTISQKENMKRFMECLE